MRNAVAAAVLSLALFVAPAFAQKEKKTPSRVPASEVKVTAPEKELIPTVEGAVALLYTEDLSGGMRMTCTATAYEKTAKGYRFVSASHCVSGATDAEQKQEKFFLTSDGINEKNFIPAKLIQAGDKNIGDDFSIYEVETDQKFNVIPLGDSSKLEAGDAMIDVAAPMGLGKQLFVGYVSLPKLDRPPVDAGEVKWTDLMLIQIGGGPGSSGSAIISVDQRAIVGFLVGGGQADIGKLCVPVSKFKAFLIKVEAGKYVETAPPAQNPNE